MRISDWSSDVCSSDLRETPAAADFNPTQAAPPRAVAEAPAKESLIAADLTIEGKIEGAGHVRIAGKFKGDVNVQGDLTIEKGAKLSGGVKAKKVMVCGEVDGYGESASSVELPESGETSGDRKAGTPHVAPGPRTRGRAEGGRGQTDRKE